MPFRYSIESSLNLLYYAGVDVCTGDEIIQTFQALLEDPLYQPNMLVIFDLLSVTELDFSVTTMHQAIARIRELHAHNKASAKAVVLTRQTSMSHLISAIQLMAFDLTLNWTVCRDLPSAIEWLDLDAARDEVLTICKQLISSDPSNILVSKVLMQSADLI